MAYQRIENYGVIGDLHTIALVGINGSIDWFCFPRFDSPSIFAAILDDKKGGHFKIAPSTEHFNKKQLYWPETNVLITRFLSKEGVGELTDFMPLLLSGEGEGSHRLIRRAHAVRGNMRFRIECRPAFNYGRDSHELYAIEQGVCFHSKTLSIGLLTSVPLMLEGNGAIADFQLREGESAIFVLKEIEKNGPYDLTLSDTEAVSLFKETVKFWRNWIAKCTYEGRWREMMNRSALVLKLLTYEPTGAIVAAPTCSLPEEIPGGRNWDYRYTWIRDAAFTLYGLLRIGFTQEASNFMSWIEGRCRELNPDGSLQIMYGIDGRHHLTEETLDHLDGYKGSRPVRIGNGAYNQLQLDIYGELMDSVYLYNKYGSPISYELWIHLRRLINWVCDHWRLKDEGIWEVRGGQQNFVYSKVMCWVALDRGIRLAEKRSFPAEREKWLHTRDLIYEEIMSNGWNEQKQAFTQYYGSETLDAANLIMPLVFFVSPSDPRMLKTLDAILRSHDQGGLVSDGLVFRYNVSETADGLIGEEGTFNICTFWLVEALTRAGKTDPPRLEKARLLFEQMLGYANHLGLYAEETGLDGEALGNFPQAFTHLALISAAYNLDRALSNRRNS